ncbi:MarR family transcriptional regulator [Vibrio metoecus]|uniref:MarR family transcriptional regulator n=1 Tax=Vibrio metoecus TaxID=1481663 RepID=A0ABR4S075_VIBMT|nr:MarR family transcriptional regulator [Vibrio metoecus]KDO15170.1 MarR family transcriptional regulator [Vibrio metoecus]KQA98272.1 MarR family transcriptional regulator [Vibrio metoecus]PAR58464.1 MarR family transcriptional regulator [Vibrio metoecus]PAR67502.1 MarR family transcriptional regulator [Vibrio metoecus]
MLEKNLEKMERFAAKVWRKYGKEDPLAQLSFNEYDYLKVIQNSPQAIRLTDLAIALEVTKPSASNMIKKLERRGLVKRVQCEEDARSQLFELTEQAGLHLASEARVYQVLAQQVAQHLSPEEAIMLDLLLSKALRQ